PAPPMPLGRSNATGTVIDGLLYVSGGSRSGDSHATAKVDVYDPRIRTWQAKPDMPTARFAHVSGTVSGKLYVIGGTDFAGNRFANNEVYTPGGVWVNSKNIPPPRESFAVAVVNGKLYAFGGSRNSSPLATGHVYDPGSN